MEKDYSVKDKIECSSKDLENLNLSANPNVKHEITSTYDFGENDLKRFTPISQLRHYKSRKVYMDLIDVFASISKGSIIVFNQIKLQHNYLTNIAVMSEFSEIPANKRRAIYQRLVELRQVGLILKVKADKRLVLWHPGQEGKRPTFEVAPHTYMINPWYIKPNIRYAEARKNWQILSDLTFEEPINWADKTGHKPSEEVFWDEIE